MFHVVLSVLNVPLVFPYKTVFRLGSIHVGGPTCDDTASSIALLNGMELLVESCVYFKGGLTYF